MFVLSEQNHDVHVECPPELLATYSKNKQDEMQKSFHPQDLSKTKGVWNSGNKFFSQK